MTRFTPQIKPIFKPTIKLIPAAATASGNIQRGKELAKKGNLAGALAEFEALLERDAASFIAHLAIGNIKYQQKLYPEAETYFQQAIRLDPLNAKPYVRAARACLNQGKFEQALVHFQDALKLNNQLAVAHMGIGQILIQQGKPDEAVQSFTQALTLNPRLLAARKRLSQVLVQQGRSQDAVAQLKTVLRVNQTDASAYIEMGRIHLQRKDYAAAQAAYQTAIALNPKLGNKAQLELASSLIEQGKVDEASQMLVDFFSRTGQPADFDPEFDSQI